MTEESKYHPIQLEFIGVKELIAKTFVPPTPDMEFNIRDGFKQGIASSEYNSEERVFSVLVQTSVGEDNTDSDYPGFISVAIIGHFKVISDDFKVKDIKHFAENYSIYLLQPYIRDYFFFLSAKCGFKPILLPLTRVPIFQRKDMVKKRNPSVKRVVKKIRA